MPNLKSVLVFTAAMAIVFIAPPSADAWFWKKKKKKKKKDPQLPPIGAPPADMGVAYGTYIYDYAVAHDINSKGRVAGVYVICADCSSAPLARLATVPDLSIRFSSGQSQPPPPHPDGGDNKLPEAGNAATEQQQNNTELSTVSAPQGAKTEEKVEQQNDKPCLLGTIYFGFDKAIITSTERAKLTDIINTIKTPEAQPRVRVYGYTCDLGSQKHNDALAVRRANAVAKYLSQHAIAVAESIGKGKCCYVSDSRRLNRRAEIVRDDTACVPSDSRILDMGTQILENKSLVR